MNHVDKRLRTTAKYKYFCLGGGSPTLASDPCQSIFGLLLTCWRSIRHSGSSPSTPLHRAPTRALTRSAGRTVSVCRQCARRASPDCTRRRSPGYCWIGAVDGLKAKGKGPKSVIQSRHQNPKIGAISVINNFLTQSLPKNCQCTINIPICSLMIIEKRNA